MGLTHFNKQGRAKMVDISDKTVTTRTATARSQVQMNEETLACIQSGDIAKGDVLAVAQVAGIIAAKKTSDVIPMCHPLALSGVDIAFMIIDANKLQFEVTVKTTGRTGVEMEALTAAQVVGLTIYDMCKAIDKEIVLGPTFLVTKTGGKSGDYHRE
jgi:cyclic pyranopterin phosphate synthase